MKRVEAFFPTREGLLHFDSEKATLVARGEAKQLYRTHSGAYVLVDRFAGEWYAHLVERWEITSLYWSLEQVAPLGEGRPLKVKPAVTVSPVVTWGTPRVEEVPGWGRLELLAETIPGQRPVIKLYRTRDGYLRVENGQAQELGVATRLYSELPIKYVTPRRAGFRARQL